MFMKRYACFLFLNPQDAVGLSISSSVVLCSFALLVDIVVLVLIFYLCPSSVRVVPTFPGTVSFPYYVLCSSFFSIIHWFFSFSGFVIPSKCLKNVICAASKRCSSLFFSIKASVPNFNADLAVVLWIRNFVSLFICFPKRLRIAPFWSRIILWFCENWRFMKIHQWILFWVTRIQYVAVLFVKSADRIFRFSLCSQRIRKVDACMLIKPEVMSWYCQRIIIVSHWNIWDEGVRELNTSGAFTEHRNKGTLLTMVRHRSICMLGNHKFMINFGKQDNQSWLSVWFNDAVSC